MKGFQDTGSFEEYITFKENFRVKLNPIGELSKIKGKEMRYTRKVRTFQDSKKFNIDSVEVEVFPVDHSLPGACGFILHTSTGSIGYTGDVRFHGRRRSDTQEFVERCGNSGLTIFLCEGTRVREDYSKNNWNKDM